MACLTDESLVSMELGRRSPLKITFYLLTFVFLKTTTN